MDSLRNRRKRNILRHRGAMQEKLVKGRSLGERSVTKSIVQQRTELLMKLEILAHNESIQTTFNHSST